MKACPNFTCYAHDGDFVPLCKERKATALYSFGECYSNYDDYEECATYKKYTQRDD